MKQVNRDNPRSLTVIKFIAQSICSAEAATFIIPLLIVIKSKSFLLNEGREWRSQAAPQTFATSHTGHDNILK